jgi:hypothetical protein
MKTFNIVFAVLFVLFAALQYNDPDPFLWMPIYLYPAALCALAVRDKYYPPAVLSGIIVFSAYAIYKVFDQNGLLDWLTVHHAENIAGTMKATKPWIEESREFFGLAIIVIVLVVQYRFIRRNFKRH